MHLGILSYGTATHLADVSDLRHYTSHCATCIEPTFLNQQSLLMKVVSGCIAWYYCCTEVVLLLMSELYMNLGI